MSAVLGGIYCWILFKSYTLNASLLAERSEMSVSELSASETSGAPFGLGSPVVRKINIHSNSRKRMGKEHRSDDYCNKCNKRDKRDKRDKCDKCHFCDPCKVRKPDIFKAKLNGRNEVPPNCSGATGTLVAVLSSDKQRVDYIIQTNNLSNITAAHFHDGRRGQNGPIVKDINIDPITGAGVGSWTTTDVTQPLTAELIEKLKQGRLYVNVHTTNFPGGEIRGQVSPLKKNKTCTR